MIADTIRRLERLDAPLDARTLAGAFPAVPDARFSLTSEKDLDDVRRLADWLLERGDSAAAAGALEEGLTSGQRTASLVLQLAVKLVRSKRVLQERGRPLFLSVVFAVYREHERILTQAEHPDGEDFLRRKLSQLAWLLHDIPDAGWELIVVDDGCPEGSGRIAARIAAESKHAERVRTVFLEEAIAAGHPATTGLATVDDSRKGGSIQLGMWEAAAERRGEGHVIVFTDADLSTHLGQCGLLVSRITDATPVAIGSRRVPRSVVVKGGARNDRGKLFIYLWKRMLAPLRGITDTQCGFKAFRARIVRGLLDDVIERRFAFDLELMLRAEISHPGDGAAVATVGVAWIDSEALSTTTALQPYLAMIQGAAKMYRRYLEPTPEADAFADFIERLDEPGWQKLSTTVPDAIRERHPQEFGDWNGVNVEALRAAIG